MRLKLFILIFVILSYSVIATDLCDEYVEPNIGCKLVTPVLNCSSYNYSIYNKDNYLLENGNLSQYSENIYYINFFENTGEYIIKLCDNSTVQINVKGSEVEMIGFIILWLGLWIFGYYAIQSKNDIVGITMIILTIPLDIYFSYKFREVLMLGTGWIGIAMTVMAMWTFAILLTIKRSVQKTT